MLWPDWPFGSYCDCRMYFIKNHQGTLRNKISYSQVLEGTEQAQGPHSEAMGKERGGPGALPLLGFESGVSRVLRVHYLFI